MAEKGTNAKSNWFEWISLAIGVGTLVWAAWGDDAESKIPAVPTTISEVRTSSIPSSLVVMPTLGLPSPPQSGHLSRPDIPVETSPPALTLPQIKPLLARPVHAKTGRAVLKTMEQGHGPSIEIQWPLSDSRKAALYDHMKNCFGMIPAVLTGSRLYRAQDEAGREWDFPIDRYSGYLRRAPDLLPAAVVDEFRALKSHHGIGQNATNIFVFPRSFDAVLVGGLFDLAQMTGTGKLALRAKYEFSGRQVKITNIHRNGRPVAGDLILERRQFC